MTTQWKLSPRTLVDNRFTDTSFEAAHDELCAQCRKIDLGAIFDLAPLEVNRMGTEVCTFTGLNRSMKDAACLLCRTVASLVFLDSTRSSLQDYASGQLLALPSSSISGYNNPEMRGHLVICVISLDSRPVVWDSVRRCAANLAGVILPSANATTEHYTCHGVDLGTRTNPFRIREMLSRCAKEHRECLQPTHSFPMRARVIDCNTRRLVPMTEHCRYLALSYVWGNQKSEATLAVEEVVSSADEVPSALPATIEDAVRTTQDLGLRYLWVDRYCIEQYHSADKKYQINQMANIYNRAVATLCALGAHDNTGLPGISRKRIAFTSFRIRGRSYSVSPDPGLLQKHLEESVWSTRGWTFQEALLSRRCIFFTDEQLFHVCRKSCQSEGISQSTPLADLVLWGSFTNIFTMVLDNEVRWSTDDILRFYDHAQHYQRRQFTLDTDALPAFKGFLSVAGNQSYYGVLVFDIDYAGSTGRLQPGPLKLWGFVHGLVWEVERYLLNGDNLRSTVPSWSWLSRKYALPRFLALDPILSAQLSPTGLACVGSYSEMDSGLYFAQIHVKNFDGLVVAMQDFLEEHQGLMVVPGSSPYLYVTSLLAEFTWTGDGFSSHKLFSFYMGGRSYHLSPSSNRIRYDKAPHNGPQQDGGTERFSAILLLSKHYPDSVRRTWHWLIVKRRDDGTYRRTGLVTIYWFGGNDDMAKMVTENFDNKTTICLG
ncbi:heterokaryon incompatibility protein-domain-containing protein [Massariosphaeria phaeospora]|uniref:Heterokaryon incompatibility protein-domain-containing protein n=1 Tax=Massariosphaeria phaeospora TaxID=100035 RepID=A0A7C8M5L5_9PLEO|nr:heterokaryon incompatibility protein-domain-containing protein [Massariosphaeria phaeospora]